MIVNDEKSKEYLQHVSNQRKSAEISAFKFQCDDEESFQTVNDEPIQVIVHSGAKKPEAKKPIEEVTFDLSCEKNSDPQAQANRTSSVSLKKKVKTQSQMVTHRPHITSIEGKFNFPKILCLL